MAQKNVRNLTAGHLRAGDWFFAPAGEQGDTVPGVEESKIPAEVLQLSRLAKPLVAIEGNAAPKAAPKVEPKVEPKAEPPEPLVVPDL